MPTKITARFGSLSEPARLPISFSAFSMSEALPTIVSRSPICNTRSGVARSITPLRSTRDTVTPNVLRKRNEPRRLPLISGRDTMM